ncbi:FAD-dependent oxidoreductase [candidate division KSB1 bacterium]
MADSNNGNGKLEADLLIVGGGIAGMTAAIEAAETGLKAVIVEKNPYLGGRIMQLYQYFPKLCPPICGMEINLKRIKNKKDVITTLVDSKVTSVEGESGNYTITVTQKPRYINDNCTLCKDCEDACTSEIDNDFNFGMSKIKAVHVPHETAFPAKYILKKEACSEDELKKIKESCKYDAVDLDMAEQTFSISCKSVVFATGWKPYDPANIETLNFNSSPNIITNMMMERLSSPSGPSEGKILRPSDNKELTNIAFVQCAGSRDENYLPYCSGVCCMASMKQASYVREQYPEAEIHIFYIDIRSPGRLEDFYQNLQNDEKIHFHRGKVAKIVEADGGNLTVTAENTLSGELTDQTVEMVVLATGLVPSIKDEDFPFNAKKDDFGFLVPGIDPETGFTATGTATRPLEVSASIQDATGTALQALKVLSRR